MSYHSGLDYCLICRCKSDVSTIETILYEYSLNFVEACAPFNISAMINFIWEQKIKEIKVIVKKRTFILIRNEFDL